MFTASHHLGCVTTSKRFIFTHLMKLTRPLSSNRQHKNLSSKMSCFNKSETDYGKHWPEHSIRRWSNELRRFDKRGQIDGWQLLNYGISEGSSEMGHARINSSGLELCLWVLAVEPLLL